MDESAASHKSADNSATSQKSSNDSAMSHKNADESEGLQSSLDEPAGSQKSADESLMSGEVESVEADVVDADHSCGSNKMSAGKSLEVIEEETSVKQKSLEVSQSQEKTFCWYELST